MLSLDLDLAPYDLRTQLDAWRAAHSRESMRRLARFVLEHGVAVFWPSPSSGRPTLWQARPEIAAEVRAWLLDPATRAGLESCFTTVVIGACPAGLLVVGPVSSADAGR